ncbi:MAG: ATP cone domain-containing protein [Candidatus Odinarchaeota archaeon]
MVKCIIKQVVKRDGSIVPFDQERIAEAIYRAAVEVGGRDKELAQEVSNDVVRLMNKSMKLDEVPHVEEINDFVEKVLIERGHARTSKAFILARTDKLAYGTKSRQKVVFEDAELIPYKKIWNVLVWNLTRRVETLAKVNEIVSNHDAFVNLITDCEVAYQNDVDAAAQKVIERKDDVKVVIIGGPSSSGKTTTTIKLEERLKEADLSLVAVNVDNYFFDLEMHPKDEFGDYDFETPQAIDMQLFNQHLKELVEGKEVETPIYDFKQGIRLPDKTETMQISPEDIILIDCLHGFYPALTSGIEDEKKFNLYIESLAQQRDSTGYFVRWADIRLLRRSVRDMQFRKYSPEMTLTHWHYVRRSELRHIIPYNPVADHIINGALAYELPIHKHFLGHYFPEFVEKYRGDTRRVDAFIRAERILKLFDEVEPWDDIDIIPKTALIREYIGGSSYEY